MGCRQERRQSAYRAGKGKLAFQEWGDPHGRPVIALHTTPGSRLERYPDEQAITDLGVRLITFDRPGYGLSEPVPGRTALDGADDVVHLADHLGIEKFSLSGMPGGGPFALADCLGSRRPGPECGDLLWHRPARS
jgi:pimeloyl-ACP methyl ester carboxylesterase